tara:strand:+ start:341 stop:547 length:207 start_codon:yes stop_codon:yes gene_type:complete
MNLNDKYFVRRNSHMAKINESVIVIKVSELVKDNEEKPNPMNDEAVHQLQQVIQELAGPQALVEIERS